jgi:ATP-binding cassette, subfamily B, bacterial PglK
MLSAVRLTLGFLTSSERAKYYALISARALTGLLDVVGIALIAFIAGIAAGQLDPDAPPPSIAGIVLPRIDAPGVVWLVIFVLVVFVLKAALAIVLMRTQAHFIATIETANASRIVGFLLGGSLGNAKRYSKADFQFAVTNSAVFAFTGLLNNVASLVAEGFLLVVIAAAFFVVDPLAAIFALLYFGAVVVLIQLVITRSLKRAGKEAVAGTVDTVGAVSDTLDAFREISVLHKERYFTDRITASRARIARSGATLTFLGGMPRYVVETSLILGVVILVAQQFLGGSLATGLVTVGVFLAGGVRMMASLLPLQSAFANIRQNSEQAAPALDLLVQARGARGARDVAVLPGAVETAVAGPRDGVGLSLRMQHVTFGYADGDGDVVHDVSLEVAPGAHVAIIGPSGAGKTTVVDLILGLISPREGQVTLGEVEPTLLRRIAPGLIGYVPQKPGLVSGTIAENIALGVEPQDIDATLLDQVIDAAYLRTYIDSLPDGVQTSVGKQADALSGGQVQRIGVARALYTRPRLIVLDEATSGLDAGSEAFISSTLRDLHGRVTVIVIAHRLSTVQHADLVYVIEDGRVVASGDFPSVRRDVPMVADYVKLMSFDEQTEGGSDR